MIVVMGPGRCGTTFLIQVLNALGFDTGGGHLEIFRELSSEIKEQGTKFDWPDAIKGTGYLCHELKEKADFYGWDVSYIFICYRQLDAMIKSRIAGVHRKPKKSYDGMCDSELYELFKQQMPYTLGTALHQAAFFDCPVTLVKFPRSAKDIDYLYSVLSVLKVTRGQVENASNSVLVSDNIRFGG
jgi:hypothetical protein